MGNVNTFQLVHEGEFGEYEHPRIEAPSFWQMEHLGYALSLMIHGDGCLGVSILKRSSQPKLKLRDAITLEFFAPAKTVVLLKSTVCAAQAGACDGGVSPATRVRGSPSGAGSIPARYIPQSRLSPFRCVYRADPEPRTNGWLRRTEVHLQLFF